MLGAELKYCEFYSQENCCGNIPCTKRGRKALSIQKNHDFDFTLPIHDDQQYLIQTRDPAPQILSHIEITFQLVRSNAHERDCWLGSRIQYFWRFYEKWVDKSKPNFLVLDYDDLSADPVAVLGAFFQRYNLDVPDSKIVSATDAVSKNRSLNGKTKEYAPRKIESKDILDLEKLAVIESAVLSEVPSLECKRKLDRVNFSISHLYWHARALRALNTNDAKNGYEWAQRCAQEVPDNPMYHLTLARICNRMDRIDEAMAAVENGLAVAGDVEQFTTRLNRLKARRDPVASTSGEAENKSEVCVPVDPPNDSAVGT